MTPEQILQRNRIIKQLIQHPLFVAQFNYYVNLNQVLNKEHLNIAEYMVMIQGEAVNYFHNYYDLTEKTQVHAIYNAGAIVITTMHSDIFASGSLQLRSQLSAMN